MSTCQSFMNEESVFLHRGHSWKIVEKIAFFEAVNKVRNSGFLKLHIAGNLSVCLPQEMTRLNRAFLALSEAVHGVICKREILKNHVT